MAAIRRLFITLVALLVASSAMAQNKVPSERALETLVKSSLMSFNDANLTGNYDVFHAKLSKPFRQQFTSEWLKASFKDFADKEIDIAVIAVFKPTYDPAPTVDGDGKLVVKGFFPTEPARVIFNLAFIPSDGEWKLIRVNVETTKAP
jgi:hypothetical protein